MEPSTDICCVLHGSLPDKKKFEEDNPDNRIQASDRKKLGMLKSLLSIFFSIFSEIEGTARR